MTWHDLPSHDLPSHDLPSHDITWPTTAGNIWSCEQGVWIPVLQVCQAYGRSWPSSYCATPADPVHPLQEIRWWSAMFYRLVYQARLISTAHWKLGPGHHCSQLLVVEEISLVWLPTYGISYTLTTDDIVEYDIVEYDIKLNDIAWHCMTS